MPRRTLPPAVNAKQPRPPHERTKRIEANDTTTAFIQDFAGLKVRLVGATKAEEFRGSGIQWRAEQAKRRHANRPDTKQPTDTIKE